MATMKTLCSVSAAGIKCFQTRFGADCIKRIVPAINSLQVRHGRYKSSPLVSDDPDHYTKYESSRNPEEWKFVEDLLPVQLIPEPQIKSEYPSGWHPQDRNPNKPYFIRRTANHMLPVYMNRKAPRGQQVVTRVGRIGGDVFALEKDISRMLHRVYPNKVHRTQVNEIAGKIVIRGDYATAVREYLLAQGW